MSDEAFEKTLRIVREIHRLFKAGRANTPEHEALCDAADGPWYRMSRLERELAQLYSVALYGLAEGRRPAGAEDWPARGPEKLQ